MLHIRSNKFRQQAIVVIGLLVIALATFAVAQNKKEEKKEDSNLTLKDVVVREGKSGIRLKDPSKFELVKQGDSKFAVRFKANKKIVGSDGCGVCPGGNCTFLFETPTSGKCHGCGGTKDCTINPF